jgi:hypothetical protein
LSVQGSLEQKENEGIYTLWEEMKISNWLLVCNKIDYILTLLIQLNLSSNIEQRFVGLNLAKGNGLIKLKIYL